FLRSLGRAHSVNSRLLPSREAVFFCLCVTDVFDADVEAVLGEIVDIGPGHRRVEEGTAKGFFGDEDERRNFLVSLLVPHDDLSDVLIELGPGVLARHLEFIRCRRLGIEMSIFWSSSGATSTSI